MLVAVSGGPDSTALLATLREHGCEVVAAHYDHRLRPGSELDAEHVARLCAELGVRLLSGRRQEPLPGGSRQAAARRLRHRFLEEARVDAGCTVIALGHTADDVIEGVLIHLLRGSALAGLRGMPRGRGRIVRPLLQIWRREIECYLQSLGIVPLRDPANHDLHYARARVRHQLLPSLERDRPGLSKRLLAVAERAGRSQAALESAAGALVRNSRIEVDDLGAVSEAIRLEALKLLYVGGGGASPGLGRRHLDAMARLALRGRAGDGLDLPGGLRLRRLYGAVEVGARSDSSPARVTLVSWNCPGCAAPGAVHLRPGATLTVGHRTPGLRMRPQPDRGSRKLQDILVDAKVPRHRRDELSLVFADGQLAWVPGIALDSRWAAPAGSAADHVEVRGAINGLC